MKRTILKAMIAAVTATHMLGNAAWARTYSGSTEHPENQTLGLVVTAIDVRQNKLTLHQRFANNREAILKGVMFFEGDVEDSDLVLAYPGREYNLKQYLKFDYLSSTEWVDKGDSEELVVQTDVDLAENTSRILGFTNLFWMSAGNTTDNVDWGRANYERCFNSAAYQENEDAICRAEVWDDGLYYQPYVGWSRLLVGDEPEGNQTVAVFKDSSWTELVTEPDTGGSEGGESGSEGGGGSDAGSENGGNEPQIVYVDRIIEVPVEIVREVPVEVIREVVVPTETIKEVIKEVPVETTIVKEVIKEVPVETTVVKEVAKEVPVEKKVVETVEVQVPVEKTVVDVREIVKEVPVATQAVATGVTTTDGGATMSEVAMLEGMMADEETADTEDEDSEDAASDEEMEPAEEEAEEKEKMPEVVEVPALGKEETKSDLAGKIATFAAGIISAVGMLIVVIVYRRKKQNVK